MSHAEADISLRQQSQEYAYKPSEFFVERWAVRVPTEYLHTDHETGIVQCWSEPDKQWRRLEPGAVIEELTLGQSGYTRAYLAYVTAGTPDRPGGIALYTYENGKPKHPDEVRALSTKIRVEDYIQRLAGNARNKGRNIPSTPDVKASTLKGIANALQIELPARKRAAQRTVPLQATRHRRPGMPAAAQPQQGNRRPVTAGVR